MTIKYTFSLWMGLLTHWGRVTHICVSKLTSIGSDNGLSPGRRQAIIWTNAWILLIGPLGTNFSEILIKILTFSFMKMRLKVSSAKWRPFCLGLNVLIFKDRGCKAAGIFFSMYIPAQNMNVSISKCMNWQKMPQQRSCQSCIKYIEGLVQKGCNSSVLAMEFMSVLHWAVDNTYW